MEQLRYSESLKLLKKHGFRVEGQLVKDVKGLKVEYPVAMKIASKDIVHKTDAGCVFVGVEKEDAELKFHQIITNARKYNGDADIEGVVVQEMVEGVELIIGGKYDPIFGPVVMFGLGGIFVEALKDVSFRVAPFDKKEALRMIEEIKGVKILHGIRGKKGVDVGKLADVLVNVGEFMFKNPEIEELDFNPVIADDKDVKIVDIRLMK